MIVIVWCVVTISSMAVFLLHTLEKQKCMQKITIRQQHSVTGCVILNLMEWLNLIIEGIA